MGIQIQTVVWVDNDDPNSSRWRLAIHVTEQHIAFGFHFGDKTEPTHTFTADRNELISALTLERNKS